MCFSKILEFCLVSATPWKRRLPVLQASPWTPPCEVLPALLSYSGSAVGRCIPWVSCCYIGRLLASFLHRLPDSSARQPAATYPLLVRKHPRRVRQMTCTEPTEPPAQNHLHRTHETTCTEPAAPNHLHRTHGTTCTDFTGAPVQNQLPRGQKCEHYFDNYGVRG